MPNTLSLPLGTGALVTGSNMSGKSTFLRTIGVTTVMAQTLNTCLAPEYKAPVFRVRSCIGRSDNLVERHELLHCGSGSAAGAGRCIRRHAMPHLFVVDELFRGTNTVERIARRSGRSAGAGFAMLPGLTSHLAIAATHDAELVDLLAGTLRRVPFWRCARIRTASRSITGWNRGRAATRNAHRAAAAARRPRHPHRPRARMRRGFGPAAKRVGSSSMAHRLLG